MCEIREDVFSFYLTPTKIMAPSFVVRRTEQFAFSDFFPRRLVASVDPARDRFERLHNAVGSTNAQLLLTAVVVISCLCFYLYAIASGIGPPQGLFACVFRERVWPAVLIGACAVLLIAAWPGRAESILNLGTLAVLVVFVAASVFSPYEQPWAPITSTGFPFESRVAGLAIAVLAMGGVSTGAALGSLRVDHLEPSTPSFVCLLVLAAVISLVTCIASGMFLEATLGLKEEQGGLLALFAVGALAAVLLPLRLGEGVGHVVAGTSPRDHLTPLGSQASVVATMRTKQMLLVALIVSVLVPIILMSGFRAGIRGPSPDRRACGGEDAVSLAVLVGALFFAAPSLGVFTGTLGSGAPLLFRLVRSVAAAALVLLITTHMIKITDRTVLVMLAVVGGLAFTLSHDTVSHGRTGLVLVATALPVLAELLGRKLVSHGGDVLPLVAPLALAGVVALLWTEVSYSRRESHSVQSLLAFFCMGLAFILVVFPETRESEYLPGRSLEVNTALNYAWLFAIFSLAHGLADVLDQAIESRRNPRQTTAALLVRVVIGFVGAFSLLAIRGNEKVAQYIGRAQDLLAPLHERLASDTAKALEKNGG